MKRSPPSMLATALLAVAATAACSGATTRGSPPEEVRPAAQAEPSRAPAPAAPGGVARRHTAADVRFMHHMMGHHAQALAMTRLVPERSTRESVRLLAERIDVSQRDEMALMRHWLEDRREEVPSTAHSPRSGQAPGPHAGHTPAAGAGQPPSAGPAHGGHGAMTMPGMLTEAELARLASATGAEFDRLFLQFMIRHHEGALAMVAELLASPGAAQESETFRIASDVDADQRAEIARMRTLLNTLSTEVQRR